MGPLKCKTNIALKDKCILVIWNFTVSVATDYATLNGSDVVSVSCFGVRFSVMFHFMFVHYTFSSVWVAEWPPFGK